MSRTDNTRPEWVRRADRADRNRLTWNGWPWLLSDRRGRGYDLDPFVCRQERRRLRHAKRRDIAARIRDAPED